MPVSITALIDPEISPASHRLVWLASDSDGIPVGAAFLRLYARAGQTHLAELQLRIHPQERHTDTGFSLLDAAVAGARDHGRQSIVTLIEADSPAERFRDARHFHKVLTLTSARLPLPDADITALAEIIEKPHPGYRLVSWDGMVPDEIADTFVASRRAMNDTPSGGIDFSAVPWDLQRVRAAVAAVEKRGDVLHTVVAISETDGAVAGYTESDGKGYAQHYGTAVLPEHRGHRLGLWMKAASIHRTHERHPLLDGLLTVCWSTGSSPRSGNASITTACSPARNTCPGRTCRSSPTSTAGSPRASTSTAPATTPRRSTSAASRNAGTAT
jgi:GNAT superfamily N-acetyltransferase